MKRFIRMALIPSALSLLPTLLIAFVSLQAWDSLGNRPGILLSRLTEGRSLEQIARILGDLGRRGGVAGTVNTIIWMGVVMAWVAAVVWFVSCWRTRLGDVGEGKKRQWVWFSFLSVFTLMFGAAATFLARSGHLFALMQAKFLLVQGSIALAIFMVAYFLSTFLFTSRIYRQGVPLGGFRPW